MPPLERALDAPRADVSATFAVAVACFTIAMVSAPFVFSRGRVAWHLFACGSVACAWLLLAASARSVTVLLVTYGVIFGLGAGYGVTLQLIALALASRPASASAASRSARSCWPC